ncbi:MAG: GNAT family N-acetyltransferase [Clostridia bacterium]|nr:GNAT family N-acetyltransferase [Clostridia bacterium]
MLIESKNEYIGSLTELWHKVFGDDEEYIKLFFKEAYYDCDCFAEISEGKIVSAFYLLKSSIRIDGKLFNGRYLYAAATLPEYRGKGLMAKLIKDAQDSIKANDIDFIALVPASDSLYDFYGRFGFKEAMHKYKYAVTNETATMRAYREITDSNEFCKIRGSAGGNMLIYNDVGNAYAFDCLRYYGSGVYYINDNAYYAEGEELFCPDGDTAVNFINNLCSESVIYLNCEIPGAEKVRNGMIYALDDKAEFKDIYMNLALD